MEIRYLDLTALIVAIVSVLMVGCAIDSGNDLVIIEEPQEAPAPVETPTEVAVEEPKPAPIEAAPASPPIAPPAEQPVVEPAAAPPKSYDKWLSGTVIDLISTRPSYTLGTIREDNTFRKYEFSTDLKLQRWMKVTFKVNRYDEVLEIISNDVDNDGVPDVQVRNYGTSIKGYEDGLRVMEGTLSNVRHDRNGKTYGIIKVHDGGFKTYGFDTYEFFSNGDNVKVKLDVDNHVVEMKVI